ncbi:MAG: hypothetical protein AAF340_00250 [Pseudomonadota bacterium]
MFYLIPVGAIITLAGLALLVFCITKVSKAKKAGLSDDEMREALQSVVPMNLGALFLSGLGLMMVIVGIMLS